jgi:hypothetical protein
MSMPDWAKQWMEQWREAGPALEAIRIQELRALTDHQAREWTEGLLELAAQAPMLPHRKRWSGLVVQQALFHRLRPPG